MTETRSRRYLILSLYIQFYQLLRLLVLKSELEAGTVHSSAGPEVGTDIYQPRGSEH